MRLPRWTWLWLLPLMAGCQSETPAERGQWGIKAAECRRASGPVTLDGKADEPAWKMAQPLEFAVAWEKRKPRTATTARLLWDDDFLYFTADMEDSDLYADITEHNGQLWSNDVFEMFLKPSRDQKLYYEFQVNPANARLELLFPSRGAGGFHRFAPLTKLGMESAVKLRGTLNDWRDKDEGWSVEGRIPWTAFKDAGGKPKVGDVWLFALCRYDYSAALDRTETSSTAPLSRPDFHGYEEYSTLTFVGPAK